MSLMPTKKTWTSPEGVQVEFITYRTILVDRIRLALGLTNDTMTNEQSAFILCAATTVDVILPAENVPLWAQALHGVVKSGSWLKDPRKDYEQLAYAPSELVEQWWQGYLGTRDNTYAAPSELQQTAPLPPDTDDEEEGEESANPTGGGVPSLSVLSSTKSGTQSTGKSKKTS